MHGKAIKLKENNEGKKSWKALPLTAGEDILYAILELLAAVTQVCPKSPYSKALANISALEVMKRFTLSFVCNTQSWSSLNGRRG